MTWAGLSNLTFPSLLFHLNTAVHWLGQALSPFYPLHLLGPLPEIPSFTWEEISPPLRPPTLALEPTLRLSSACFSFWSYWVAGSPLGPIALISLSNTWELVFGLCILAYTSSQPAQGLVKEAQLSPRLSLSPFLPWNMST